MGPKPWPGTSDLACPKTHQVGDDSASPLSLHHVFTEVLDHCQPQAQKAGCHREATTTASLPWGRGSVAGSRLAQGRLECAHSWVSHFATHRTLSHLMETAFPSSPQRVGGCCTSSRGTCMHGRGAGTTAPLTAGSTEASGTFNPLCKVLCILQSLYLCTIGPMLVFCLARDTPCASNCSPKPLYSWIQVTAPQRPWHTVQRYGTVSLCCGPFQGTSWHHSRPGALTCSTAHSIIWIPQ